MKNNDVQDLLRKIVNPVRFDFNRICIVRAYQGEEDLITVEPITSPDFVAETGNPDNYIYGVRLTASQPIEVGTGFGVIIKPEVGSFVIINTLENGQYYVSMYSHITEYQFRTPDTTIHSKDGTIQLTTDNLVMVSKSDDPEYGITFSVEHQIMSLKAPDAQLYFGNDGSYLSIEKDGNTMINNGKGALGIDKDGQVVMLNNYAEVMVDSDGKIKIHNSAKSIKADVFDKIQTILTSLDAGLTALGGVDPTRTANIAALIPTLALLLKD